MKSHSAQELASRIQGYMADAKLVVATHVFFTSPLSLKELPEDLKTLYSKCDLVIFKGDGRCVRCGVLHVSGHADTTVHSKLSTSPW